MPPGDAATPPARGLSPRHVRRTRLTTLLDESSGQAIVINAPAGYGKTMLAREWLYAKERVAWLRASPATADLAAFSAALADAAATIVPAAKDRLHHRARVADTPEEAARPLAELLAEDLAGWPDDGWLAIDDYHLVADSAAVEDFLDWLLALAPIRLLVTTRRRPAWATARRVLYGEVTEITRDDLAMTADEAGAVLSGRPTADVDALIERAQGWPAVIGLAGLSAAFPSRRPRISDALFRYFAEEVFRREPHDVQDFMLAAAVPTQVDERVASDVLGVAQPYDALARLEDEGLLHHADGGMRFHPLLRDFLLRKLDAHDSARREDLFRRAIDDARARGDADEAFELAAESGNRDVAADVAADAVAELLAAGRVETVERWLAACEPVERPALLVAKAEVLIRRGDIFAALALAHDLARRLPPEDPHASPAWYVAGRAFHLLSEDERALQCHLKARESAKTTHDRANALWGVTVLAAQLEAGVMDEVVADLETVAGADADAQLESGVARVFLASRRGSLAGVWDALEPLVALADDAMNPMGRSSFLSACAYVNTSRGRYALAQELAERAVDVADRFRLGRAKRSFCLCQRVAADIGLRRFKEAERALAELAAVGIEQTQVLVAEQRNLRAKLLLARRSLRELVAENGTSPRAPRASLGEYAGLMAIAAAASGFGDRAATEAARAEDMTASIEARYYGRFATVIASLASGRAKRRSGADAGELVAEVAEAGILDAFVIGYRAYPPLLEVVARDPQLLPVVKDVVNHANDQALAKRVGVGMPAEERANGRGTLTPREAEVLELMTQGLGNAEIARRLFISEKTAKVHVYHIFEKLGVESRVQAVLLARELANGESAAAPRHASAP